MTSTPNQISTIDKRQIATQEEPKDLSWFLTKTKFARRLESVLGSKCPQFVSSVIDVANSFDKPVNPESVCESAMIAATLDLPVNKNLGFAWIVPYKSECQFQMGFKGYIQLALRTGQYKALNALAINEGVFVGRNEIGEPIMDWTKLDESMETVGYCVAWRLVNGFSKVCYWPKAKIEKHAKQYSQAYRKGSNTPWKTHFDEMALKTVIANELRKWGIMSVDMQKAYDFDQSVIRDGMPMYVDNQIESVKRTPDPRATGDVYARNDEKLTEFEGIVGTLDDVDEINAMATTLIESIPQCEADIKAIAADRVNQLNGDLFNKGHERAG